MPRFEEIDWYDTPLYYDLVFDVGTVEEADFLEAAHSRWALPAGRGRRVLEPACGSGRLVVELARRGWRVQGSDLSRPMLDHAAERLAGAGLQAKLSVQDMSDLRLGAARFDLAHCLVSTFKYLLDEKTAEAHLRGVAEALRPGGIYVLGFHLTDYEDDRRNRERWVVERGRTRVVCNIQGWPPDRKRRREAVRSRLVVHEGERELRSETSWEFRTYDAAQVRRLLRRVPELEHVATRDFNYRIDEELDLDGEHLDVVLVLRRRA